MSAVGRHLIEHHQRVSRELRVYKTLSEQHAVRHVLDDSLGRRAVFEADRVANFLPQPATELLRHSLGNRHGRHAPRLRAGDDPAGCEARLRHVLSHLGGLAGAGLKGRERGREVGEGEGSV